MRVDGMANGKPLRQRLRSGTDGDVAAFRGIAKDLIAEERQKHHHLLANDLETILYGRSDRPASPRVAGVRRRHPGGP